MGLIVDVTWALTFLIVLVAAFILTATGFGFALVVSPLLLIFLDPKTVIVYNLFLGLIVCLPILWQCRHYARSRQLLLLGVSSLIGLPLGTYILSNVASPVLKLLIAGFVVIFAVILALGYSYRFKKQTVSSVVTGFVGGTLMTSTGLGGPPVVLFLLNQGCDKNTFRASMMVYLVFCGIGALVALAISGVVTGAILLSSLSFIPALAVGFYLGIKVLPYIHSAIFRRIVLAIVILTGLLGVVTSLSALL